MGSVSLKQLCIRCLSGFELLLGGIKLLLRLHEICLKAGSLLCLFSLSLRRLVALRNRCTRMHVRVSAGKKVGARGVGCTPKEGMSKSVLSLTSS